MHIRKGKVRKARFVVAGQRSRKAMRRYLIARNEISLSEPLFLTRSGGRLDRSNLLHLLKRTGERSRVGNVYVHQFRHTFAINFLRNGGSSLLRQELLGHESLDTVLNYVELAERDIDESTKQSPADKWAL